MRATLTPGWRTWARTAPLQTGSAPCIVALHQVSSLPVCAQQEQSKWYGPGELQCARPTQQNVKVGLRLAISIGDFRLLLPIWSGHEGPTVGRADTSAAVHHNTMCTSVSSRQPLTGGGRCRQAGAAPLNEGLLAWNDALLLWVADIPRLASPADRPCPVKHLNRVSLMAEVAAL